MARIQVIAYATDEVGIKIDHKFDFYKKANVTVSSNEGAVIKMYNGEDEILSANTEEFIVPSEASVQDLILLIKAIIT